MAISSSIVLFAVVWFMVMFVVLPIGRRTQGDENKVVPGTHPGSPVNFNLKRTMLIVTGITIIVWGVICAIIISGVIPLPDLPDY